MSSAGPKLTAAMGTLICSAALSEFPLRALDRRGDVPGAGCALRQI